jgi:glutamate-ammonia-ligase adenylyltransferase
MALARLGEAGFLDRDDAAMLIKADHLWRSVQGLLRITLGREIPPMLPEPVLHTLIQASGRPAVDLAGFRATLDDMAEQVRTAFTRIVGPVADSQEKGPT